MGGLTLALASLSLFGAAAGRLLGESSSWIAPAGRSLLDDNEDRQLFTLDAGVPILSVMTLRGSNVTNGDIPAANRNATQNGFLANPIDDRARTTQQPYAVADMVLYRSRLAYTVTLYNAQNLQGYGNITSGQIHIRNRAKTPLSWLVGSPSAPLSVQLPAAGSILLASGNATFLPSSPVQDNSDLLNQILDGKLYTDIHSQDVISPYALLSGRPSTVPGFNCGSDGEDRDNNDDENDGNDDNNSGSTGTAAVASATPSSSPSPASPPSPSNNSSDNDNDNENDDGNNSNSNSNDSSNDSSNSNSNDSSNSNSNDSSSDSSNANNDNSNDNDESPTTSSSG